MDSQKCQGGIEDVRGAQACEAGAVPNIVHSLRFFFRSGIAKHNDCIFLRSFGLRAYITFICALTCSLCSATLFSASIFASYLVETPFRPRWYWYVSWSACRRHSPSQTIRSPAVCMSQDMHCLAAEVCAFSSLNCCCDFTHQLHSDNFQKGISRCTDLWHGIIWNPPYRYVSAHSLDCSFGVSVVTCSRMHLQTRCHLAKRRWTPCCRTPPFSGETQTVTGIWCCSGRQKTGQTQIRTSSSPWSGVQK